MKEKKIGENQKTNSTCFEILVGSVTIRPSPFLSQQQHLPYPQAHSKSVFFREVTTGTPHFFHLEHRKHPGSPPHHTEAAGYRVDSQLTLWKEASWLCRKLGQTPTLSEPVSSSIK